MKRSRFICWLSGLLFLSTVASAQTGELIRTGTLPKILKESSALEYTAPDTFWTVVDSNKPVVYGINVKGELTRAIHLNNLNRGWEDIAKDEDGNFYVGDFGNNFNNRQNLKIYKIPPPSKIDKPIITAEIIKFQYEDQTAFPPPPSNQTFDMDAMVAFNGNLYLFSKNRTQPYTGICKMYKLPATPGDHTAELIDSVYLGPGPMLQTWVTGAAMSPDGKQLALLSHDRAWIFHCFPGDQFFKGKKKVINFNHFSQKEGICFTSNTELYITDELTAGVLGGCIYTYKLPNDLSDECK